MQLTPRFRLAGADDVAAVVDLVESAYRGETSRAGWTTEADLLDGPRTSAAEVAAAISGPASVVLAASEDQAGHERLVACCQLTHDGVDSAGLGMFAVRPGLQGAGLGRAVVERAQIEVGQRWGARRLGLWVFSVRPELIAWYGRLGFAPTGRRRPFDTADPVAGARRGDLVFIELAKALSGGTSATGRRAP